MRIFINIFVNLLKLIILRFGFHYSYFNIISRGAFSEVVIAKKITTNQYVAIKCIKRQKLKGKEDNLQNEISVLRKYWIFF
jgi:serine/threonine protein kinase